MAGFNAQEQIVLDALSEEGKAVSYRAFVQKLNESNRGTAVRSIDGLRVSGRVIVSLGLVEGATAPVAFIRLPEHPAPSYVPESAVN